MKMKIVCFAAAAWGGKKRPMAGETCGRRLFLIGAATAAALASGRAASANGRRQISLIEAPSNLGLRPLVPGREPGAWRAPQALRQAGLEARLRPVATHALARPIYNFEGDGESRIRNGRAIRAFSEALAPLVEADLAAGHFPLVIGGDCSILPGCLPGAGEVGLIQVDGHSDFYHPGNYDTRARLGSVAGMDLALATGRGEPLLADWDGRPLVADDRVVQIGERDELTADFDYRDIEDTAIHRIPVRRLLANGIAATVQYALSVGAAQSLRFWLHIDLDVLDGKVMPAVDSPGSPGLTHDQLADLVEGLLASGRIRGASVTIYDPELDRTGRYAREIVACLGRAFDALDTRA